MQKYVLLCPLLLLTMVVGCSKDSNPIKPQASFESEINDGRPYNFIYIQTSSVQGWQFEKNAAYNSFTDAYADNGYLIVVNDTNMVHYFNLSLARDVMVEPDSGGSRLYLYY